MPLPIDYAKRVYAGVLGKIVGVYLGRPVEGWSYERIAAEIGEIWYYVDQHPAIRARGSLPLVLTDDDISGTFTFVRALADYEHTRALSPAQIGQTWLNYIVERRTILWWGGMGNSTEHTAYLRLKSGIAAPESGSARLNSQVVAEQIGAQIFIDGWAMVAPGDPALAADLARRAASVSHDGAAIHAAQAIAAMEAQAFVEPDLQRLLDCGLAHIPRDSIVARLIADVREWHARDGDWRRTRERIAGQYGYDRYGGNCHVVPNHALIVLALLYGDDDFQRSLMIVNTSGWDTDCNSANVGCLLGIKNGLSGIAAGPDWRGPVADRMYLPTADGGRAVTDAATEAYHLVNGGRALAGLPPLAPKDGARFHFELPGSVQGFQVEQAHDTTGTLAIENVAGHSRRGAGSLALRYRGLAPGRAARAATATFIPPEAIAMPGYALLASPTIYPGQLARAGMIADAANEAPVDCRLYLQIYGAGDVLARIYGPAVTLAPGAEHLAEWRVPDIGGAPIAAIGVELTGTHGAAGSVYLDYLRWDGAPEVVLTRPEHGGTLWRRAWVDGTDQWEPGWPEPYRLVQNAGVGLISQGTREWTDYRVEADVCPHIVASAGIGARVQGLRRYYALLLARGGLARLVKELDGSTTLAEAPFPWEAGGAYALALQVTGDRIQGWIDGRQIFDVRDASRPLLGGGVALICEEGRTATTAVRVSPAG